MSKKVDVILAILIILGVVLCVDYILSGKTDTELKSIALSKAKAKCGRENEHGYASLNCEKLEPFSITKQPASIVAKTPECTEFSYGGGTLYPNNLTVVIVLDKFGKEVDASKFQCTACA